LQKIEVKHKQQSNSNSSCSDNKRTSNKRGRDDKPSGNDGFNSNAQSNNIWSNMLIDMSNKVITENSLSEHLQNAVDKFEIDAMMQSSIYQENYGNNRSSGTGGGDVKRQKVFIVPNTQLISYSSMLDDMIKSDKNGSRHQDSLTIVHDSTVNDSVVDLTDDSPLKTFHVRGKDVQKPAYKWVPFPITSIIHTISGTNNTHSVGYVLVSTDALQ